MKSSRKAQRRRTAAAGGLALAAAGLGLTPCASPANAETADHGQNIVGYSNSLDNILAGTDALGQTVIRAWNPAASHTGGPLPAFSSSFSGPNDLTSISSFPGFLQSLANTPLPTAVPGVAASINIPGKGVVRLPLPTTIPGAGAVDGFARGLDMVFAIPGISLIVDQLPPLSQTLEGLTATQTGYQGGYNWQALGLSGQTYVTNIFVQTPDRLAIGIPNSLNPLGLLPSSVQILPPGSLPQVTRWLPTTAGNYQFPAGAALGFWAATSALDFAGAGVPHTTVSFPMSAIGAAAPFGLGTLGQRTASSSCPHRTASLRTSAPR